MGEGRMKKSQEERDYRLGTQPRRYRIAPRHPLEPSNEGGPSRLGNTTSTGQLMYDCKEKPLR
jgi:hypothetical protein